MGHLIHRLVSKWADPHYLPSGRRQLSPKHKPRHTQWASPSLLLQTLGHPSTGGGACYEAVSKVSSLPFCAGRWFQHKANGLSVGQSFTTCFQARPGRDSAQGQPRVWGSTSPDTEGEAHRPPPQGLDLAGQRELGGSHPAGSHRLPVQTPCGADVCCLQTRVAFPQ